MRIGVRLDLVPGLSASDLIDLAVLAEDLKYETIWVPEGIGRDALTQLAAFAANTKRIKLGTGILPIYYRSPTTMAMSAAGMDVVSNHRFILGLGVGHPHMVGQVHGVQYEHPIPRVRETVEIVRRLLKEREVDYQGRFYTLKGATVGPLPEPARVPIYIAALGPKMTELAGQIADGALLNWVSHGHMSLSLEQLRAGAMKSGRDPSEIDIACYIRVMVTDDPDSAQLGLRRLIARYTFMPDYKKFFESLGHAKDVAKISNAWRNKGREAAEAAVSEAMIRDMAIVGTAEYCRKEVKKYLSLGLKMAVIAPFASADTKGTYISTMKAFIGSFYPDQPGS